MPLSRSRNLISSITKDSVCREVAACVKSRASTTCPAAPLESWISVPASAPEPMRIRACAPSGPEPTRMRSTARAADAPDGPLTAVVLPAGAPADSERNHPAIAAAEAASWAPASASSRLRSSALRKRRPERPCAVVSEASPTGRTSSLPAARGAAPGDESLTCMRPHRLHRRSSFLTCVARMPNVCV